MSSPATVEWSDVINRFIDGLKNVLYQFGDWIATNAATLAEVTLGIGLAYFAVKYVSRIGIVRNFLGKIL